MNQGNYHKSNHNKLTDFTNTNISSVNQKARHQDDCQKEQTVYFNDFTNKQVQGKAEGISIVLLSYIPIQIIQTVQNNQTRQCKYLLFHLPFTLMVCDTLQIHKNNTNLYLFDILKEEIKIIHQLARRIPAQMSEEQSMKVIIDAINFKKMPNQYFLNELTRFLQRNAPKMSTFMPYYYYLFELVSKRNEYVEQKTGLPDVITVLSAKIRWIRDKFHNFDLQ